jgi:hypothetical protein
MLTENRIEQRHALFAGLDARDASIWDMCEGVIALPSPYTESQMSEAVGRAVQMSQGPGQMSPAQALQINIARRQALLATSPRFTKNLGIFSGGVASGNTRAKLYNVGVTTGLLLKVTTTVDIRIAPATISSQGPFNLISRLRLTDFDGSDRVNLTGDELFIINCIRAQEYVGYANGVNGSVLSSPVVPTAVIDGQALSFFIYVPLAFDPERDLRGSMLMQTSVGEVYLSIDWNSAYYGNADVSKPYNGAGTTTVGQSAGTTIGVQVWQDYLIPQSADGQSLPIVPDFDLLTVYELNGNVRSSDNLAANTEKLINFPNVRSVIGMYLRYINNNVMNAGTDVSQLRIIANGNNILYDQTADAHLYRIRLWCNSMDLRAGYYPFLFRGKPVETRQYGNVQVGFTPSSASGTNYVGVCTESFYTKGATLPGMMQASG